MRRPLFLLPIFALILFGTLAFAQTVLVPEDNVSPQEETAVPSSSAGDEEEAILQTIPDRAVISTGDGTASSVCRKPGGSCGGTTADMMALVDENGRLKTPDAPVVAPGGALKDVSDIGFASKDDAAFSRLLAEGKTAARSSPSSSSSGNPYAAEIERITEEVESKMEVEPLILDDSPFFGTSQEAPLPLKVVLFKDYSWGLSDASSIRRALGYKKADILKNCQLRLDVSIKTSVEGFVSSGMVLSNAPAEMRYDGDVQRVSLTPKALCRPPSRDLPRRGAILFRWGNNYTVVLGGGTECSPGTGRAARPANLFIRYGGDDDIECLFK